MTHEPKFLFATLSHSLFYLFFLCVCVDIAWNDIQHTTSGCKGGGDPVCTPFNMLSLHSDSQHFLLVPALQKSHHIWNVPSTCLLKRMLYFTRSNASRTHPKTVDQAMRPKHNKYYSSAMNSLIFNAHQRL